MQPWAAVLLYEYKGLACHFGDRGIMPLDVWEKETVLSEVGRNQQQNLDEVNAAHAVFCSPHLASLFKSCLSLWTPRNSCFSGVSSEMRASYLVLHLTKGNNPAHALGRWQLLAWVFCQRSCVSPVPGWAGTGVSFLARATGCPQAGRTYVASYAAKLRLSHHRRHPFVRSTLTASRSSRRPQLCRRQS